MRPGYRIKMLSDFSNEDLLYVRTTTGSDSSGEPEQIDYRRLTGFFNRRSMKSCAGVHIHTHDLCLVSMISM